MKDNNKSDIFYYYLRRWNMTYGIDGKMRLVFFALFIIILRRSNMTYGTKSKMRHTFFAIFIITLGGQIWPMEPKVKHKLTFFAILELERDGWLLIFFNLLLCWGHPSATCTSWHFMFVRWLGIKSQCN